MFFYLAKWCTCMSVNWDMVISEMIGCVQNESFSQIDDDYSLLNAS